MTTHDDLHLRQRLRSLGEGPVPGRLQASHLASIAGASPARRPSGFWTKARVGVAFLAGLLLGGSGLATAGALPDPAQDVAHHVFGAVGMNIPEGRSQAGCDGQGPHEGLYANHGEFVSKAARGDVQGTTAADAAQTECGKPIGAGGPGAGPAGNDNPCRPPWAGGKPAWAGPGTEEEKAAARDEAKAGFTPAAECDDEAEELEAERSDAGIEQRSEAAPPPVEPAEPAAPAGDPGPTAEPTESTERADPADPPRPEPAGNPSEPVEDDPLVEE